MTTRISRGALTCALLATTCLAAPAFAQSAGNPSVHKNIDGNGVDLTDGSFNFGIVEGSIGAGEATIALAGSWGWGGPQNNFPSHVRRNESGSTVTLEVVLGTKTELFSGAIGAASFSSGEGSGATLTIQSNGDYLHTDDDGTVTKFVGAGSSTDLGGTGPLCGGSVTSGCELLAMSSTFADGRQLTYTWDFHTEYELGENETFYPRHYYRLRTVSNNSGYSVRFSFVEETFASLPGPNWYKRSGATFRNSAAGSGALASVVYSYPDAYTILVTDTAGRQWRFAHDSQQRLTGVRRPGSASDNIAVGYDANGRVSQVIADGVTTNYAFSDSGSTRTATVTNALSQQNVVTSNMSLRRPTSFRDALNRTTSIDYDSLARPTKVTAPEGNYVQYTYDARGNVTQTLAKAKPGTGLADITSSASYPSTCSNPKTCNKPLSTTDARGQVTDYSYDATHGGLLSVTAPAAPNGVRPQTRYAYTFSNGIYLLTATSACQTQQSCAGTADEVKTTIGYGANNLPTSTTSGAGDNSLVATSAFTYDFIGNLLTVDGPLAGTADTTRYRYDAARQLVGTISADPDGGGVLKHRAVRATYRPDGQVSKTENGTVTDQSDAAWAAFAPLEAVETGFDANNRPITSKLVAGGATHALTQVSYDAVGRAECTAQRMNPAAFGSLPVSACSLGAQGSFGPDRIGKVIYDAAGQVTQVQTAVGTAEQANEVTSTYRLNGQVETLTDGENNRTTYVYDGHDRLLQTQFPHPTKGAGVSNAADYEQLTYDSGSNVTSKRLRDGNVISLGYDNLSRLISKDLPNTVLYESDATYAYDNLGRMTSATALVSSLTTSFAYDALGRMTSAENPHHGFKTYQHDAAGRRTRMTWKDGMFVSYDYLTTGEMSAIRENGSFVLASFGYDDLGRRASLTRGNGTTTSYAYDAASRLGTLFNDFPGTGNDFNIGMGYNPAGQIVSRSGAHGAYAWTGHGNGTTSSSANGLNQLASHGGVTFSHDARGNLTNNGTRSFGYTVENLLATMNGSNVFAYDALGRIYHSIPALVNFGYDGARLTEELGHTSGFPFLRRYVHGPGIDEPLVWYEGSGTSDRRYLHADERGSITAVSDGSGNAIAYNAYDEYGRPQPWGNPGRFGYTGQAWLPEVQVWYYKARMMDPKLGRFLQTDRLGYIDGMNIYAYVRNDPVNFTDPTGLKLGNTKDLPPKADTLPNTEDAPKPPEPETVVTGERCGSFCTKYDSGEWGAASSVLDFGGFGPTLFAGWDAPSTIVVTAQRTRPGTRAAPRQGPMGLRYHEGQSWNGHTLRDHVGRTHQQLATRLRREGKRQVSSFSDSAIANAALRQAVRQNEAGIRGWLVSGHGGRFLINLRSPIPLGVVLSRGDRAPQAGYSATFVLQRNTDPFIQADFVVITGWVG